MSLLDGDLEPIRFGYGQARLRKSYLNRIGLGAERQATTAQRRRLVRLLSLLSRECQMTGSLQLATHSFSSVVLPKPAGVEMSVSSGQAGGDVELGFQKGCGHLLRSWHAAGCTVPIISSTGSRDNRSLWPSVGQHLANTMIPPSCCRTRTTPRRIGQPGSLGPGQVDGLFLVTGESTTVLAGRGGYRAWSSGGR